MLWINNINWWQKWMVGRLKRQEINAFKLIGFYSLRFLCRIQSVFTVPSHWWKAIFELEPDEAWSRNFFFSKTKKSPIEPVPNRTQLWGNRSRFCNFLTKSDFFRLGQFEPNSDDLKFKFWTELGRFEPNSYSIQCTIDGLLGLAQFDHRHNLATLGDSLTTFDDDSADHDLKNIEFFSSHFINLKRCRPAISIFGSYLCTPPCTVPSYGCLENIHFFQMLNKKRATIRKDEKEEIFFFLKKEKPNQYVQILYHLKKLVIKFR